MKTLGLIGGMSWESTVTYYQIINETVKKELGGLHSARCLLYSVDFEEIERYQAAGDWDASARVLMDAAQALERAGADAVVICTNTMHKVAPQVAAAARIPLLHIAELTARELHKAGIGKVGLLGTRYTMEQPFYKDVLTAQGIDVLVPPEADRALVHDVIYGELCLGTISPASKREFLRIIDDLTAAGAQGVILGCTEIGLLVQQADTSTPVFDTAEIHARQAALWALENN